MRWEREYHSPHNRAHSLTVTRSRVNDARRAEAKQADDGSQAANESDRPRTFLKRYPHAPLPQFLLIGLALFLVYEALNSRPLQIDRDSLTALGGEDTRVCGRLAERLLTIKRTAILLGVGTEGGLTR